MIELECRRGKRGIFIRLLRDLSHRLPEPVRRNLLRVVHWWNHKTASYHLISYPKCGRTWLRMMIGYCFVHHFEISIPNYLEIDFLSTFYRSMPTLAITHDDDPHRKSPGELNRDKSMYSNQRVLFLVRDPRDVMVSNYFQQTRRSKNFQGTLSEFIRHSRGGVESYLEFLNIWSDQRTVPTDFLLVRYEDIHEDTLGELNRVLSFMDMDDINRDLPLQAVEEASFQRMRKKERDPSIDSTRLSPGDESDPESYKVRRGKVGGYTDYLSTKNSSYIEKLINEKLTDDFGYKTSVTSR